MASADKETQIAEHSTVMDEPAAKAGVGATNTNAVPENVTEGIGQVKGTYPSSSDSTAETAVPEAAEEPASPPTEGNGQAKGVDEPSSDPTADTAVPETAEEPVSPPKEDKKTLDERSKGLVAVIMLALAVSNQSSDIC